MIRTITTKTGQTLYVAATVPQADGGVRYLCATTPAAARSAAYRIREDPAMADHLDLIPVDSAPRRRQS